MLRRSSLVECPCVSVLHGTCLQSVDFFFIRQYVQPCLSKNPKYTFYTIKSSLTLAYYRKNLMTPKGDAESLDRKSQKISSGHPSQATGASMYWFSIRSLNFIEKSKNIYEANFNSNFNRFQIKITYLYDLKFFLVMVAILGGYWVVLLK